MASLLTKDAYLQSLARKICSQPSAELQKCESAGRTRGSEAAGPPEKKRNNAQKKPRAREEEAAEPQAQALGEKSPAASGARRPVTAKEEEPSSSTGAPADGLATEPDSVFALDVLRQRLHEKIREARGQGSTKEVSPATLERRRRRKQERDRRKRKRKELRAQEKAAKAEEAAGAADPPPEAPREEAQGQPGLLFNKVEVSEEEPASKAQRRKEERRELKGNLTPLTGKNYRQLLERLRARQGEGKARELEAEGVKTLHCEHRRQEALRRTEKRRAQRR
ncbi:surfeit locus protein 6-like [Diceros bicornis minor]|uniref:surfeit locus protein 6-like n=1 Tax=Diceros bicornis minor TaxID=77932 RepID=UPI0026E9B766|nr:surfeit locus protein 6-like [Diceros bicornis minor]